MEKNMENNPLDKEIDKIAFYNSGEFKRYIGEILKQEDITVLNIGRTEEFWNKFEIKKNYVYIEFYGEELKIINFIRRLEEDKKRFYLGETSTVIESMGSKIISFKGRIGWLYKPISKIKEETSDRDEVFKFKEKNRRITGVRGGI
ncbi:MAG: hypothetical protein RR864_05870 [Cetobacterium sp.]